jgi:hypothetical protein
VGHSTVARGWHRQGLRTSSLHSAPGLLLHRKARSFGPTPVLPWLLPKAPAAPFASCSSTTSRRPQGRCLPLPGPLLRQARQARQEDAPGACRQGLRDRPQAAGLQGLHLLGDLSPGACGICSSAFTIPRRSLVTAPPPPLPVRLPLAAAQSPMRPRAPTLGLWLHAQPAMAVVRGRDLAPWPVRTAYAPTIPRAPWLPESRGNRR